MGLERYVVDAVLIEKRSPTEIATAHGISRSWLYELIARVRGGGYEALAPHSRRPRSCPREVGEQVVASVLQLRQELLAAGHDAGPQTIAHHLAGRVTPSPPSRTTIWRILRRRGLITHSLTSGRAPPSSASRPACPTNAGRPTPPTGTWPRAPRSRS